MPKTIIEYAQEHINVIKIEPDITPSNTFSAIDPTSQILAGRQASKELANFLKPLQEETLYFLDYNQEKEGYNYVPSVYHSIFVDFLEKNVESDGAKYYNPALLKIEKVTEDDHREVLRGQDKVVTLQAIKQGQILGIYTGIILYNGDESKDMRAELDWLSEQEGQGLAASERYMFGIILNKDKSLLLSAYGRGNLLMKINAPHVYDPLQYPYTKGINDQANVEAIQMRYGNGVPFIALWTTKEIKKGEEILYDYGANYWKILRKGQNPYGSHREAYEKFKTSQFYSKFIKNKERYEQIIEGQQIAQKKPNEFNAFLGFLKKTQKGKKGGKGFRNLYQELKDHGLDIEEEDNIVTSQTLSIEDRLVQVLSITRNDSTWRLYQTPKLNVSWLGELLTPSVKKKQMHADAVPHSFFECTINNAIDLYTVIDWTKLITLSLDKQVEIAKIALALGYQSTIDKLKAVPYPGNSQLQSEQINDHEEPMLPMPQHGKLRQDQVEPMEVSHSLNAAQYLSNELSNIREKDLKNKFLDLNFLTKISSSLDEVINHADQLELSNLTKAKLTFHLMNVLREPRTYFNIFSDFPKIQIKLLKLVFCYENPPYNNLPKVAKLNLRDESSYDRCDILSYFVNGSTVDILYRIASATPPPDSVRNSLEALRKYYDDAIMGSDIAYIYDLHKFIKDFCLKTCSFARFRKSQKDRILPAMIPVSTMINYLLNPHGYHVDMENEQQYFEFLGYSAYTRELFGHLVTAREMDGCGWSPPGCLGLTKPSYKSYMYHLHSHLDSGSYKKFMSLAHLIKLASAMSAVHPCQDLNLSAVLEDQTKKVVEKMDFLTQTP